MEEKKKKFNLKIIVPIAVIIAVVFVGFLFYETSDLSKDYYYFLQYREDYAKAYEKAKNDSERLEVIQQNAIAYVCRLLSGDQYSYMAETKLKNAWYDKDKRIVLHLSFSTSDNIYAYFTYKEDTKNYEMVCLSESPISEANLLLSDDYSATVTNNKGANLANAIIKQSVIEKMSEIMTKGNEVKSRTIGNVNAYFNTRTLSEVTLFKPTK